MKAVNYYYRIYDEKLELLYETTVRDNQKAGDNKLSELLNKSKLFLNIGNISCYRIEPELK